MQTKTRTFFYSTEKQPLELGASSNEMPISNSVTKDPLLHHPTPHLIIDSILGCAENRAAIMILKVIFRSWRTVILYQAATSPRSTGAGGSHCEPWAEPGLLAARYFGLRWRFRAVIFTVFPAVNIPLVQSSQHVRPLWAHAGYIWR